MAKRFTDTDKWKKPFIRSLPVSYRLLWFYVLDDCDLAGLWQVDFEIAQIRIGCQLEQAKALDYFKDHIILIDEGEKWFIPAFLEFQYGSQLSKTNNIFKSIEKILIRYNLLQHLNIEITETGTTISSYRNRVSKKLKEKICLEASLICQYCQEKKDFIELTIDHFVPLKKGGDNSDENLVCSCIRCNSHKTDSDPDYFLSRGLDFLNPTSKINSLLTAYKKLKAPFNPLLGGKDKDKDKEQDEDRVKDKEKYFGKSENLLNEKFLVPQMCKIWYQTFPAYTTDQANDFEGMGKILQFISRQANLKNTPGPDDEIKILNTLQLIADEAGRDGFWINKPIKTIANNIQEFYNKLKNPQQNGKQSATNPANLRTKVQAERDRRREASEQEGN